MMATLTFSELKNLVANVQKFWHFLSLALFNLEQINHDLVNNYKQASFVYNLKCTLMKLNKVISNVGLKTSLHIVLVPS